MTLTSNVVQKNANEYMQIDFFLVKKKIIILILVLKNKKSNKIKK